MTTEKGNKIAHFLTTKVKFSAGIPVAKADEESGTVDDKGVLSELITVT
ncbi:hypothetical protein ESA_00931 [Cronobacter sakazakii ATCC BAA-894]|uniref:Uncharacterized protein n=1 Tax=Cronobacter sakazakii (strain ATCC BAA-894) TaxID=290339 RepID=A7MH21_CROS8|nr:hypothetical protein ESA_00931 [Cronobacter sakazakii ATCC BAA-894]